MTEDEKLLDQARVALLSAAYADAASSTQKRQLLLVANQIERRLGKPISGPRALNADQMRQLQELCDEIGCLVGAKLSPGVIDKISRRIETVLPASKVFRVTINDALEVSADVRTALVSVELPVSGRDNPVTLWLYPMERGRLESRTEFHLMGEHIRS